MRRLPVYFLIDVSESMVGEPIGEVEKGLYYITRQLRSDPYALETVYISVLVFSGSALQLNPLTELTQFRPLRLPIGSGTSLGAGLEMLMNALDREISHTTAEKKGDWQPIIFLFTDGAATDDPDAAIARWRERYMGKCRLAVITFGRLGSIAQLEALGGDVWTLDELTPDAFAGFFQWVSSSIQISSIRAVDGGVAEKYCGNLEKASAGCGMDERFVILASRCSTKGSLYLIKYRADEENGHILSGAWPVDEEIYLRLGGNRATGLQIDASRLHGNFLCPICEKNKAIVHCRNCGGISCGNPDELWKCPWCHASGSIERTRELAFERRQG